MESSSTGKPLTVEPGSTQLADVARAEQLSDERDWAAAAAAWDAVVARNPVNGKYFDALGRARFALGEYAAALAAYEHALALGVWSDGADPTETELGEMASIFPGVLAYRVACCAARTGDHDRALETLETALAQGFRDVERLPDDEHLASLRGDPRFVRLTQRPAVDGFSRLDGWRVDLAVLCAEARRRAPGPPGPDFDAAAAALEASLPDLSDLQILGGMWRLLRHLGDGHARLDVGDAFPAWEHTLPVWFYLFSEGVFVTAAEPSCAELLGAELLAVDGAPTAEVLAALDPLLTRDNDYGPRSRAAGWLRQPALLHAAGVTTDPTRATLTVRRPDGTTSELTVSAGPGRSPRPWPHGVPDGAVPFVADPPAYLRDLDRNFVFDHHDDLALVHLRFHAIADEADETIAEFVERMFAWIDDHDAGRLVIDLRWNGGGNTFLALRLVHRVIGHPRINRRGSLFVIVGRATFSAAQNTATFLDRHTAALFVGEPSGSRPNFVGETAPFTLPHSGIRANVSDLYWQTSWPIDDRVAIPPDIYAPPTFAAYRAGEDPAMAEILRHLAAAPDPG